MSGPLRHLGVAPAHPFVGALDRVQVANGSGPLGRGGWPGFLGLLVLGDALLLLLSFRADGSEVEEFPIGGARNAQVCGRVAVRACETHEVLKHLRPPAGNAGLGVGEGGFGLRDTGGVGLTLRFGDFALFLG